MNVLHVILFSNKYFKYWIVHKYKCDVTQHRVPECSTECSGAAPSAMAQHWVPWPSTECRGSALSALAQHLVPWRSTECRDTGPSAVAHHSVPWRSSELRTLITTHTGLHGWCEDMPCTPDHDVHCYFLAKNLINLIRYQRWDFFVPNWQHWAWCSTQVHLQPAIILLLCQRLTTAMPSSYDNSAIDWLKQFWNNFWNNLKQFYFHKTWYRIYISYIGR